MIMGFAEEQLEEREKLYKNFDKQLDNILGVNEKLHRKMDKKLQREQTDEEKKKKPKNEFARSYHFTLFGYDEEAIKTLREEFAKEEYIIAVVAIEYGKQGCHPHLQGFFHMKKAKRMRKYLKNLINDSIHVEVMISTIAESLRYVYAMDKPYELGDIIIEKLDGKQGKRPYGYVEAQIIREDSLYGWQKWIWNKVQNLSEPRIVYWFWEEKGATGKTELARLMAFKQGAIVVGGKSKDIFYGITQMTERNQRAPPIVMINIPRSQIDRIDYGAMEAIKDSVFYSGKYESGMHLSKTFPHVFVFANIPCPPGKLSEDRILMHHIDNTDKKCQCQTRIQFQTPEQYESEGLPPKTKCNGLCRIKPTKTTTL